MPSNLEGKNRSNVDRAEIARFDAIARDWWDADGPMRPLHRMNPLRTSWIAERIRRRFGDRSVRLLDVGCGAGLAAEVFARQGHDVLGLDAAARTIAAARAHAAGQDLPLRYREGSTDELLAEGARFQVVTALEVIEHVSDPGRFLADLATLLEPGGLLFLSTLNRTTRSFVTAKLGAEYVFRWLPAGTHDWRKFVTPGEMGKMLRSTGLSLSDVAGMSLNPLTGRWTAGRDTAVNYIVVGAKAPVSLGLAGLG